MSKKEPDLVPYYRPGTTEPEMVPRESVEGVTAEGYTPPADEGVGTGEAGKTTVIGDKKKATKKAAKVPKKK